MANPVFTNCLVTLNSTNISTCVVTARVNRSPEMLDNTNMGSGGARSRKRGLDDWNFELEILDDFSTVAPAIDKSLWTLFNADSTFQLVVRPTTAVRSGSNPDYSGKVRLESYSAGGVVGELAKKTIRCLSAGSSLARTTTAT